VQDVAHGLYRAVRLLPESGPRVEAQCRPAPSQLNLVERGVPVRVPDDNLLAGVREVLVAVVHSAESDLFYGWAVTADEDELAVGLTGNLISSAFSRPNPSYASLGVSGRHRTRGASEVRKIGLRLVSSRQCRAR
jgi:hypothetical protein